MLISAAARHNISVLIGLAWSGSAPKTASGLRSLASLQQLVADRLLELYGEVVTPPPARTRVLQGAYTEVEFNNCHAAAYASAYVDQYLAPVSSHIAAIFARARRAGPWDHRRLKGDAPPFLYADPYFVPKKPGCSSAAAYSEFWRRAFASAPAFTLIAPQDGVGAHRLNSSVVAEFLSALHDGSHAAGRRFGTLVELFEQHPLDEYHQPTCEHRRAAPWARIKAQLANDGRYADLKELTAWEYHAYLSPLPGPCEWCRARNASSGLIADYKGYIDREVFPIEVFPRAV
jgi:hypothetical protein